MECIGRSNNLPYKPIVVMVLNWESSSDSRNCIAALAKSDHPNFCVLLADNGSSARDFSVVEQIAEEFSTSLCLKVIRIPENLGYAGGNNFIFEVIRSESLVGDLLILNPDVEVSPSALSTMAVAMEEGVGAVTARTLRPDGRVLFDLIKLRGYRAKYVTTDEECAETDYSQGACVLLRREAIEAVGLFDSRFFLYWEEVDLAFRMRAAGYRLRAITSVTIIRKGNEAKRLPLAIYYSARNASLIRKNHPEKFSSFGYVAYIAWLGVVSLKLVWHPQLYTKSLGLLFRAIMDAHRGNYGPIGPSSLPQRSENRESICS